MRAFSDEAAMAIDDTPSSFFAPWPDRLRHSAIILLAAGLALTALVTLGELPLIPAAVAFVLIAAAALVPWRLHDAAASPEITRPIRTGTEMRTASCPAGGSRFLPAGDLCRSREFIS